LNRVGIGFIGCGNISPAYLKAAKKFPILDIVALADANPAAAEARASEFGLPARSIDARLADPRIEIVVNLTIPRRMSKSACRRSPPASTSIPKNPWGSPPLRRPS
jgi:predicted dehydrogenase